MIRYLSISLEIGGGPDPAWRSGSSLEIGGDPDIQLGDWWRSGSRLEIGRDPDQA